MNSKRKGKDGELELSHKLQDHGFNTRRGQQYNGADGSADVVGLAGIHAEVKRVERLNVSDAMSQSISDAKMGEIPCVFHRKNHEEWLVTMRLNDWVEFYKDYMPI
jgi:Holliday junction resolvase